MNPHLWWYVARASGLVAWVLVAAAVSWGLFLSGRPTARPRPAWLLDLHRFLGGLAVVFVGVHLAGLALDRWVHFGLEELFVPFASRWRPGAVAWGVTGLYLLLAIEATSLLMRRLPRRLWRAVHLTSFGLLAVSTVHLFTAGADARNRVVQGLAVVAWLAVANLLALRVFSPRRARASRAPRAAPAGARTRAASARP